jgi:hypothetical protein
MKTKSYDALSGFAVVAFVVFTFLAQYSKGAGYLFGILALATAVGLLVVYVNALPKSSLIAHATASVDEAGPASDLVHQRARVGQDVPLGWYEGPTGAERHLTGLSEELREQQRRAREVRQVHLFFAAAAHHSSRGVRVGSSFAQVKFHHDPERDTASIIANVVEKLCAASREPRFEFILGPDGSFKIRQISVKGAMDERSAAAEESLKESLNPTPIH